MVFEHAGDPLFFDATAIRFANEVAQSNSLESGGAVSLPRIAEVGLGSLMNPVTSFTIKSLESVRELVKRFRGLAHESDFTKLAIQMTQGSGSVFQLIVGLL